jgi:hypothetical protein
MDTVGTFDRLAAELTLEERRDLLRKLESQAIVSDAPLFASAELPETVSIENRFRESPLLLRLYLRLLSFFRRKSPLKLFEERMIARLGTMIQIRSPGLFDHRRNLLLNRMHEELLSLKESSRFFYEALDGSMVRDKGAFFAFLASLEFDVLHRRLQTETDPHTYAAGNSLATEAEIRQAAHKALESILASLDESQRAAMYRNVRSLLCLKELASFLFDRTLSAFSGVGDRMSCPAYLLTDQLMLLNDILYSLEFPPSLSLLESLFVFDLQDRLGSEDFQLVEETRKLVSRAEEALSRIRQFNQRVPLTAVIRCTSRNLAYLPSHVPGGEDWFAVYREYWRKRIDEKFALFVRDRRKVQLEQSLGSFFASKPLPHPDYFQPAPGEGPGIRNAFVLIFFAAFYRYVFAEEINKALKVVLLEGEFYKKENRVEFTDSYNELLKLGDAIQALDKKLSPTGDLGMRYDAARKEIIALPLKRRKLASIQQEADSEALGIAERATRALRTLSSVMGGILDVEGGGRYDTLSNIGNLSGRGTGTFISSLRNALQKIEKTLQMLGEIESLEPGR